MRLADPALFRQQVLIGGTWCDALDGASFSVTDPATGERLGQAPRCPADDVTRAIDAAHTAFAQWRGVPAKTRGQTLRRWFDLILTHRQDLATLMVHEQGKPLAQALGEIDYAASFVEWFAEEARRLYGDLVPSPWVDRRLLTLKKPLGVAALITPWNFPAAMLTRKAAAALAAGCTVVVKPASQTPFTALALAELAVRAGLPPGVLNVVTGDAETVGRTLIDDDRVRKLSFTGSTATGQRLYAACAPTLKRLSLELGGNAPFLVFADADLDAAVAGALASKYRNSGQTCVCANRLFVEAPVYEAFADKLARAAAALTVGNGFTPGVDLGPLISDAAVCRLETRLDEALKAGARLLTGGSRHPLGGRFFAPTVVADCTPDMTLCREEAFAPVAPLIPFNTEADAIAMANDSAYGLAAYAYTRDAARIWRLAEALEYGMLGVNTGILSTAEASFGGVKHSGIGREGGRQGIEEYLDTQYVAWGLDPAGRPAI